MRWNHQFYAPEYSRPFIYPGLSVSFSKNYSYNYTVSSNYKWEKKLLIERTGLKIREYGLLPSHSLIATGPRAQGGPFSGLPGSRLKESLSKTFRRLDSN